MFETTRLHQRACAIRRAAVAWSAGGAYAPRPMIVSAPTAMPGLLDPGGGGADAPQARPRRHPPDRHVHEHGRDPVADVAAVARRAHRHGHHRAQGPAFRRLPSVSPAARARLRPRPSRTTSFTVPPSASLIARNTANGRSAVANRRFGPTFPSNGPRGGVPIPATVRSASAVRRHRLRHDPRLARDVSEALDRVEDRVLHRIADELLRAAAPARVTTPRPARRPARRGPGRTGRTRSSSRRSRPPSRGGASTGSRSDPRRDPRRRRAPTAASSDRAGGTGHGRRRAPARTGRPATARMHGGGGSPGRIDRRPPTRAGTGSPGPTSSFRRSRGASRSRRSTTRSTSSYVSVRAVLARPEDGEPGDVHVHAGLLEVEEARVEPGQSLRRHAPMLGSGAMRRLATAVALAALLRAAGHAGGGAGHRGGRRVRRIRLRDRQRVHARDRSDRDRRDGRVDDGRSLPAHRRGRRRLVVVRGTSNPERSSTTPSTPKASSPSSAATTAARASGWPARSSSATLRSRAAAFPGPDPAPSVPAGTVRVPDDAPTIQEAVDRARARRPRPDRPRRLPRGGDRHHAVPDDPGHGPQRHDPRGRLRAANGIHVIEADGVADREPHRAALPPERLLLVGGARVSAAPTSRRPRTATTASTRSDRAGDGSITPTRAARPTPASTSARATRATR